MDTARNSVMCVRRVNEMYEMNDSLPCASLPYNSEHSEYDRILLRCTAARVTRVALLPYGSVRHSMQSRQRRRLRSRKRLSTAKQMRYDQNASRLFDAFHSKYSVVHRSSKRGDAMVGQQKHLMSLQEWLQRAGERRRTRTAIRHQCHRSDDYGKFRKYIGWKCDARHRKTGCRRWMRMHDRLHVGASRITGEMHLQFRRRARAAVTRCRITSRCPQAFYVTKRAVGVKPEHMVRRHQRLIDAAGGDQKATVRQTAGDVSFSAGQQAAGV